MMEKFKLKLRRRCLLISACLIALAALYLFMVFVVRPDVSDHIAGFQAGVFTSVELMLIFAAVYYTVIARDEKRLKKLYVEESDERRALIRQKSGGAALIAIELGIEAALIVAGFYNETVFFTLLSVLLFTTLCMLISKIYYRIRL